MPKTRRIAAAVLFTFLPATVSLPALAEDDAATVQARARFKEGVEAFDKAKYEEARLAFLQAYTLKKHPAVLLNLAQSSAKSGHHVDAARYFQQFLREASTATPQQRRDAEAGLAEVRQRLGRIEVVAPAGTEISLDEQGKIGSTPMDALDVEPGPHTVKSPTESVTVTAVAGQKVEAKLGASAPAGTAAPALAPAAEAATSEEDLAPARDTGTTKHTNLLAPPEDLTPVWIGLGVAGVGLVSAITFAIFKSDAQSKSNDVAAAIRKAATARGIPTKGACNAGVADFASACKTLDDNNSKVDTNAAVANVSLAVAGAGLVFAGAWYLLAPKASDEPKAAARTPQRPVLAPYAGWGNAGLSLSGEF